MSDDFQLILVCFFVLLGVLGSIPMVIWFFEAINASDYGTASAALSLCLTLWLGGAFPLLLYLGVA